MRLEVRNLVKATEDNREDWVGKQIIKEYGVGSEEGSLGVAHKILCLRYSMYHSATCIGDLIPAVVLSGGVKTSRKLELAGNPQATAAWGSKAK